MVQIERLKTLPIVLLATLRTWKAILRDHRNKPSMTTRVPSITSKRGVERPPTFPATSDGVVVMVGVVEVSSNVVVDNGTKDEEVRKTVVELAGPGTA